MNQPDDEIKYLDIPPGLSADLKRIAAETGTDVYALIIRLLYQAVRMHEESRFVPERDVQKGGDANN